MEGNALPTDIALSQACGYRLKSNIAQRAERCWLDFGPQHWYTRLSPAHKKCLILLGFCNRSGNPSLRSERNQTLVIAKA
jgi:hypothetical protein